jgi:hypothetical protein
MGAPCALATTPQDPVAAHPSVPPNDCKIPSYVEVLVKSEMLETMTINIAIVGTSNSLMCTGYVCGLQSVPGIIISDNVSIGSSEAVMAPFRLTDNVLSGADVVIFDLAVNEQRAINRGIYDVSAAAEIIRFVVARCVSAGVRPVVLLMPEGSGYRWN